jgi:hypothetical protein
MESLYNLWDIFVRWYSENTSFNNDPELKYDYNKIFFSKTFDEWNSLKNSFEISMDLYFNLKELTMLTYRYNFQRHHYIKIYFFHVVPFKIEGQAVSYRKIADDEHLMAKMVEKMREISDEQW